LALHACRLFLLSGRYYLRRKAASQCQAFLTRHPKRHFEPVGTCQRNHEPRIGCDLNLPSVECKNMTWIAVLSRSPERIR
jgi:hypothetical protein